MPQSEFDLDPPAGPTFGQKLRAMFCCGDYDEGEYESPRRSIQISGPTDFRRQDVNIAGLSEEEAAEIREKSRRDAQRMFHNLRPLASSPSGTFAERPTQHNFPSYEQFVQPRTAPTPGSSPIHPSSPGFGTNPRQPPSPGGPRTANCVSGFYGSENIYPSHEQINNPFQHQQPPPPPPKNNSAFEKVKAHSRKLSDSFRGNKNSGPHLCPPTPFDNESQVEMRHLMAGRNGSEPHFEDTIRSTDGKMSDDSFSPVSDSEDHYPRYDSGLGNKGGGDFRD